MISQANSLTQEKLLEFHEGRMTDAYLYFGSHVQEGETTFTVWVPGVEQVAVICTAPQSNLEEKIPMTLHPLDSSIWHVSVPRMMMDYRYEYEIETAQKEKIRKVDPFARASEKRPQNKSIVQGKSQYDWPQAVLVQKETSNRQHFESAMAIYELHIGTWKRAKDGQFLTYRELAEEVIPYVKKQGFTHIELMPITEHPLDESWGYQTTGYFAPTSRYGTADDLKYFVQRCSENGIGLFLDWVPGHFCVDAHALALFNGTPLYEEARPERRMNPDWGTLNFDVRKGEVISFLLSSGHYWLGEFKFDGFRMDALVNLLFVPNDPARPHNDDGVAFLRTLTASLRQHHPQAILIAEDAWHFPKVTEEIEEGGIGFHYKWNFGWMNDVQVYMKTPPSQRSRIHGNINFSIFYHYEERYISTFSHDEFVHGQGSLLNKLPGTYEEKFHQLRLLLGFWVAHPGKKLLFMGQEFGHFDEWKFQPELDWHLYDFKAHRQMALFTKDLLRVYRNEKALFELDDKQEGFLWLDADNSEQSVVSFIRRGRSPEDECIVICNFSDRPYPHFQVGVPSNGAYLQVFSTDDALYGGNSTLQKSSFLAADYAFNNQNQSIEVNLPAFTMSIWKKN
ncbi:1,4-alpha-glucan branching protein GlgB [Planococcus shixiaomingii]|uniref:1,4-alpha-glucan branching protein GlgB n=1 Tax=Planococcus shixiaomingii TaxID=3058393 RepID=UPI0026177600|nr:1,4-alpha-glucan branching protein GlgB [Planococcus sp. N022]WKA55114.1 1,4-alpha-glucan branching protein GlgB [Planococcus sp. N022]